MAALQMDCGDTLVCLKLQKKTLSSGFGSDLALIWQWKWAKITTLKLKMPKGWYEERGSVKDGQAKGGTCSGWVRWICHRFIWT